VEIYPGDKDNVIPFGLFCLFINESVELWTIIFIDAAEFPLAREHCLIQVRSALRLGYSDLGENRRRGEEIRAQSGKIGTRRWAMSAKAEFHP